MSEYGPLLQFSLSIVGGPYDGVDGLVFVTPEEVDNVPLPAAIAVARCPGDRVCRMGRRCRPGHVAYWIPELEDVPPSAVAYALEDDSIEVNGRESSARYVLGGLSADLRGRALAGVSTAWESGAAIPFGVWVNGRMIREVS